VNGLLAHPRDSSLCFLTSYLTVYSEQLGGPLTVKGDCLRRLMWTVWGNCFWGGPLTVWQPFFILCIMSLPC